MRGWNHRFISFLHDAATNALSHPPSSNSACTILDTLKPHGSVSCLHSFAFSNQISTLWALRGGVGQKPPSLSSKFFSTKQLVAPKSSQATTVPKKYGFSSGQHGGGGGSERTSWAQYLLAGPPVICAGLCKWQLERRQWKIDLLERRQSIMKVHIEPINYRKCVYLTIIIKKMPIRFFTGAILFLVFLPCFCLPGRAYRYFQ